MSPERNRRLRVIFDQALERPESQRLQFLHEICGDDREVLQAVGRLLAAHGETSFFLDRTSPAARRFGRYVISRELGRGAMGVVYEATDPWIGREVAIKVIHLEALARSDDADFMRERLFREARTAGALSHPGIVTIYDVGAEHDKAFIAMEYVSGSSLQQMLASGPRLDSAKALDILRQCAAALDYAHQNNVIHRDVKPANIMLHEGRDVKITDFGIAKILSASDHTRTGVVLGTPTHMSPEQIGAKPLDGRADQFSLATVAFQLLTGTEPFWADSLPALLQKILYEPRPSARALNPALPLAVDGVLRRAMEKTPDLRFRTCSEFVKALDGAIEAASFPATPASLGDPERLAETETIGIEVPNRDRAAPHEKPERRIAAFGAAIGVTAVFIALVYFSGLEPFRQKSPEPSSQKALSPPADITPVAAPAATPESDPIKPIESDEKPSPNDDKPARARQLYGNAIRYQRAHQQSKALDLFRQAAMLGDASAMVELGESLTNESDGMTPDYPEALRWLRKAADAGNSAGMVDLAGMYLLGNGVDENIETAVDWFTKAAQKGNAAAMYNLGLLYEGGQGVIEDQNKAEQFFNQAARLGYQQARTRLAELGR